MALTAIPVAGAKLRASIYNANLTERTDLYIAKSLDESVTSSTALQNDDVLALAVVANATYHGMLVAATVGGNAAGDIKFGWTFPTGATLHFPAVGPHNGIASGSQADGEWIGRLSATSGTTTVPHGASTDVLTSIIYLHLFTGANAGTLQLQWAQQSSSGTASTLKAGSYMWLRRQS